MYHRARNRTAQVTHFAPHQNTCIIPFMKTKVELPVLVGKIEDFLHDKIIEVKTPPQGMESEVIIVKTVQNGEIAVKHGGDYILEDILSYKLLSENGINIPVPKVLGQFKFLDRNVLLMAKVNYPLLETIPAAQMHRYIPAMIKIQKEIHKIKSDQAGYLNEEKREKSWKEIIMSLFDGSSNSLNWQEIAKRNGLDEYVVMSSVEKLLAKMNSLSFIEKNYSFIHTDFNQRNLFVNAESDEVTGVIDWGEAMFGDPICDFARIRMLIWHFDLGQTVVDSYYKLMNYSDYEKELDDLYWLSRVVEFLAYYSEDLNAFNIGRIKLHQDFLRNYKWSV